MLWEVILGLDDLIEGAEDENDTMRLSSSTVSSWFFAMSLRYRNRNRQVMPLYLLRLLRDRYRYQIEPIR